MIAAISDAGATILAAVLAVSVTTLGGVVRISVRLGRMEQVDADHNTRLTRLEQHEDNHDHWHLTRGDR